MPGWHDYKNLLDAEFTQSLEEGREPAEIEKLRSEAATLSADPAAFEALHARCLQVPIRPDFPFNEPDDLATIQALRQRRAVYPEPLEVENLEDRMLGAWLGRCVGCALGKPVEMFMHSRGNLSSRQRQQRYLEAISPAEWPLRDYFPEHSPAEAETGGTLYPQSCREHIAFMETDDDIRYTVLGQIVLSEHGPDFSTWNVARAWMEHLGFAKVCTAETQAYRNLIIEQEFHLAGTGVPSSPDVWDGIATRLNPYREWIGAQIRVDSYGYAAPGHPALAAEFAYRDARLSHVKNGIYGAMFCAAMIAAAFTETSPHAIVEAGLAEIPATSRLYDAIRRTIGFCEKFGPDQFQKVFAEIEGLLGHYDPVHTINNAAVCAAAILLSEGDFTRGVTLAVMGGWDTDCNGATVGSVIGAYNGAGRIPPFWTDRLNDTLKSGVVEYHPIRISECARKSVEIALRIAARQPVPVFS